MRHLALLGLLTLAGSVPAGAQTGLTVYADGRVLVRRTLPVPLPAGPSFHRLALGALDPGSVFPLDPAVMLTGAVYDAAVNEANTMRRAVGRQLVFETGGMRNGIADTVVVTVIGVDPERFRLADGGVLFSRPGRPRYPADLIQTDPTIALSLRAASARPSLGLGYFTDGASWHAAYQAVLSGGQARVSGTAVIESETLSADDAEVQVVAGEVGRAQPPRADLRRRVAPMAMALEEAVGAGAEEIGEVHLYTLPGRLTLRPGTATTTALFQPAAATAERAFVVRGQLPWVGPLGQIGDEITQPVEVHHILRRARGSEFGDRPLPGGVWRLYEADGAGRLQLIGEASSRHTPAGEDLRLVAGHAFDLSARRVQTDYTTRRDSLRMRATVAYRVTVANAKDSGVTVDVLEERQGEWRVLESSVPGERLSATRTRFRLRVPARGEAVLTYRMLVTW